MKKFNNRVFNKIYGFFIIAAVVVGIIAQAQAAKLSPTLQSRLSSLADNAPVGMVIVSFNATNGLQTSHLNILRSIGVSGGQTFPTLGMVAQPMNAGQVRALLNNPQVRSIWSNDALHYTMNQARTLTGVAASANRFGDDRSQRRISGFGRGRFLRDGD